MRGQRRILRIGVAAALLALAGYGIYYAYVSTRQARLISQARRYLEKSNTSTALLCLVRALKYNPRHTDTCRAMAEVTERIGSPAALLWRTRVVELSPKATSDRLALAETALRFRDYLTATNALEGISPAGKKTAAYHNVAGTVSLAARRTGEAEAHFLQASRLEPKNGAFNLNLAVLRLQGSNTVARQQARTTLGALCTNSALRCQALRELVMDALRNESPERALQLSAELVRQTNCAFGDRLLRLDVFRATTNAQFEPMLAAVKREAAEDSRKVYDFALWEASRSSVNDALAWLKTLPTATQTNQPAALLMAEFQIALNNWSGLQAGLENQNWAELDFVRHAFQTGALRAQGLSASALIEWTKALKDANDKKEDLIMLLRLTLQWNWPGEGEDLLWRIVSRYPGEAWARAGLGQILAASGRTRSLMMLYSQQVRTNPSDLVARNNLAMLALLLGAQEVRPHELARELYQKTPANPTFASTYGFSLLLQNRNVEALKVFEKLTQRQLEEPSVAGYYGMALQANGRAERAKKYFEIASKAPLLPEERMLLERAKESAEKAGVNLKEASGG